ncbi:single-stranded DNA-binding protein [Candidatus Peregrinibacteria bacterium]|nr:single-stranded DNA-binding protein [Candidatus Peregrinibacteria bacterium]
MNKVILIGNLTRDPEMRKTLNSQSVTTFGLATNREWMTKDGRKQQSAEFHELVCWARLAEFSHQNLKKGKLIYVEGHLKTRSWDDVSGVKKFRTEIVVEDLIMLDKRTTVLPQNGAPVSDEDILPAEQDKGSLGSVATEEKLDAAIDAPIKI